MVSTFRPSRYEYSRGGLIRIPGRLEFRCPAPGCYMVDVQVVERDETNLMQDLRGLPRRSGDPNRSHHAQAQHLKGNYIDDSLEEK